MGIRNSGSIKLQRRVAGAGVTLGYAPKTVTKVMLEEIFNMAERDRYNPTWHSWSGLPKEMEELTKESDDYINRVAPVHKLLLQLLMDDDVVVPATVDVEKRKASLKTLQTNKYREIWHELIGKSLKEDSRLTFMTDADTPTDFHLFEDVKLPKAGVVNSEGETVYGFKSSGSLNLQQKNNWSRDENRDAGVARRFCDNLAIFDVEGEIVDDGVQRTCRLKSLKLKGLRWNAIPVIGLHDIETVGNDLEPYYREQKKMGEKEQQVYDYRTREIEERFLGGLTLMQPQLQSPKDRPFDFVRDGFNTFRDLVYREPGHSDDYRVWKFNHRNPHIGLFGKRDGDDVTLWEQVYDRKSKRWLQHPLGKTVPKELFTQFPKHLTYKVQEELGFRKPYVPFDPAKTSFKTNVAGKKALDWDNIKTVSDEDDTII